MIYSTTSPQYGRRLLLGVAALLTVTLQLHYSAPFALTIAIVAMQLAALSFGGAPGTFSWLLFSRRRSAFPNRRRWDGAMHMYLAFTFIAFCCFGKQLSSQFLGASGGLLLLSYGCAKQGCYRLGCCGWVSDASAWMPLSNIRARIELPKLEALISFAAGIAALLLVLYNVGSETVFFLSVAAHLVLRQIFAPVRSG